MSLSSSSFKKALIADDAFLDTRSRFFAGSSILLLLFVRFLPFFLVDLWNDMFAKTNKCWSEKAAETAKVEKKKNLELSLHENIEYPCAKNTDLVMNS